MRLTSAGVTRESLAECLNTYEPVFMQHYQQGLCLKLALPHESESLTLAFEFLTFLEDNLLDYTNSFRALLGLVAAESHPYEHQLLTTMLAELNEDAKKNWQNWETRYMAQIKTYSQENVILTLQSNNPVYILRNDMAQRAIDAAEQGQFEEVARIFELLKTPYMVQDRATELDSQPPERNAPQLPISCSS